MQTQVEQTDEQRAILESWTRAMSMSQGAVTRVRIILAWAEGQTPAEVARGQRVTAKTVHKWRNPLLSGKFFEQIQLVSYFLGFHIGFNLCK